MPGVRATRPGVESWLRTGTAAGLLALALSGCSDSEQAEAPAGGTAGASVGGTAGGGETGGRAGSGGSKSTGGAGTTGGAGRASPSGGSDSGSGGKGGGGAGTAGDGTAGQSTGGMSGTDTAGGAGGEGGTETSGDCPGGAVGTWALGDDNLYMVVESDCSISNFCSIAEGIHSRGSVTNSVVVVDSVGGQALSFAYTLSGNTLTLIDAGPSGEELPLTRTNQPLPADCFEPAPSS
jgi:hypothetical protein